MEITNRTSASRGDTNFSRPRNRTILEIPEALYPDSPDGSILDFPESGRASLLGESILEIPNSDFAGAAYLDFKYLALPPARELTAREFCRKMHGLNGLPVETIFEVELDPEYRRRCIALLSRELSLHAQTIRNWGTTTYFRRMPPNYRRFLGLLWERGELIEEIKRFRRFNA